MYWRTVLSPSRRRTPPPPAPAQSSNRPGPTPYPYTLTNPVLSQFEFPSASSTPNGTPSGSEVDHDHDQDGDGEQEEGVQKSGRAGNRRRQKYSRTRTGCLSCRTRRIKCDEARPVCKRCIIAKKTVSYSSGLDTICRRRHHADDSAFGQLLRKMQARRKRNETREQGLQRWMGVGQMKIGR